MQLAYPLLSELYIDPKGRVCFYHGYDVLQDSLVDYAKENIKIMPTTTSWRLCAPLRIMKARTGIKMLDEI